MSLRSHHETNVLPERPFSCLHGYLRLEPLKEIVPLQIPTLGCRATREKAADDDVDNLHGTPIARKGCNKTQRLQDTTSALPILGVPYGL